MPRSESRTKTSIWSDDDFRKLSGAAQRMYWLLYSQPTISLCGVLALTERRWAATSADGTIVTVRAEMDELAEHNYILVDYDTEEVFVRTFAYHDGVARSPKTFAPAWKQLEHVGSPILRDAAEAALRVLGTPPPGPDGPPNTQPHSPPDTQSDSPVDTLCNGHVDRVSTTGSDTESDRTRVRAGAPSHSLLPLPIPPPVSLPPAYPTTPAEDGKPGLSATHRDEQKTLELTHRMADACEGDNRRTVNFEAGLVVFWALQYVAPHIVDEAIGSLKTPPALPRAIAKVIRGKASDRGIRMPEYQPHVRGVA